MSRNTIALHGVSQSFGDRAVLADVNLDVTSGEFVVLIGASGSGKSTLLKLIAGLNQPSSGAVTVGGDIGYAFQEPRLLPWSRVEANVAVGLPLKRDRSRDSEVIAQALEEVQLTHRAQAWPGALSGGEAQRASLARALVRRPEVLLLDEPFGALDALTRITMQELVVELWQHHGFSVVMVTHDVGEAIRLADRIVVLKNGRLEEEFVLASSHSRDLDDPQAANLHRRLLETLGVVEVTR